MLDLDLTPYVQQVEELDSTTRGLAAFGSTGVSGQPQGVQMNQNTPADSPTTSLNPDSVLAYHAPRTNLERIFVLF